MVTPVTRLLLLPVMIALLSGCAYHARQSIRDSGPFIAEQQARFLPGGWSGFLTDHYTGVLVIAGDSLFFDCPGSGSKPGMEKLDPFSIALNEIVAIDARQDAYNSSKIVKIFDSKGACQFMMKQPEAFCEILRPLTRAE